MRALPLFLSLIALPETASAHWGHLGELAGHGHWVAVGAGFSAAVLAALLGKKKLKEESDETDAEGEPETAGA